MVEQPLEYRLSERIGTRGRSHSPEQGMYNLPTRYVPNELEIASSIRVDHHRPINGCELDAKRVVGEGRVELQFGVLEKR